MLVLNKKTIDLLHSKICSIFVIEIFEIMQRNAMCSKTFVTNVLPIIFDFSPYFLIFKKIKSITQIFITEHFVSPYGTVCFHTGNSLLQGTKQLVSSKPTKYGSRDSHHSIPGKAVRTRTFLKNRPERTIRKALFFLKILPISLNQS